VADADGTTDSEVAGVDGGAGGVGAVGAAAEDL